MKRMLWLLLAMALVGCTQTTPESQVINDAAEALGGRDAILAVNTIALEGAGTNGNLGQNRAPDAELPIFEVTQFKRTIDLANGRARLEQTRRAASPPGGPPQIQNFGIDGNVAFNIGADGMATRQGELLAADRRAETYLHHPLTVVRAALDPAAQIANLRTSGNTTVVDITTPQGETVTLAVDGATHLPATVTSMLYNVNLGDVARETTFSDYQDRNGLKLPARITSKVDRYQVSDLTVSNQTVNGAIPDLAASAEVRSTPAPPVTASVTVQDVAPGIWFLAGQSHNSVLVEFSDHAQLIEVPQNETRALAVIAKAKEIEPDKPLTKVIVTHHHFDHSGGIRAAIAEGLTLVTHELNKPLFEDLAKRTHSIVQDTLAKNPTQAKIETVAEELTVKDAMRTMQLLHVQDATGHSDSMLMVYFPNEKLLVQADLFNPANPNLPRIVTLNENIENRKLRVDRHLPIHGTVMTRAEFAKVLQSARAASSN